MSGADPVPQETIEKARRRTIVTYRCEIPCFRWILGERADRAVPDAEGAGPAPPEQMT
jgi:hypothetical protein